MNRIHPHVWSGVAMLAGAALCGMAFAEPPAKPGLFDWLKRKPAEAASNGEEWTVECGTFRGDNHRRTAEELATALRAVRDLRADQVRIESGADQSTIYYGKYALGRDSKTDTVILSADIQRDMRFIRSLAAAPDQYPFLTAKPIPIPKDPAGPPEWDLARVRGGVYTLQVGVTYNTANFNERMTAAVEWVRDLRSRGHEAYYYHDPRSSKSLICVGVFGADAVRLDAAGKPQYSQAVRTLRAQEEFRYNLENGMRVSTVQPNRTKTPNESFLVRIPEPPVAERRP